MKTRFRNIMVPFMACLLGTSAFLLSQSAAALFEQGLLKENAEGDLNGAIAIFSRIAGEKAADPSIRAKAQLHIGMCYEKLGQGEARAAYQKVIDGYPQQHQEVALARERLAALAKTLATVSEKPSFRKIDIPVKLSWQSPTPNGPVTAFGACLSPDGKTLAFGSEGSIWVIPVPGKVSPDIAGEPRRLTEAIYAMGSGISWSADGNRIGFNAAREDGGEDIYVVPFHGGEPAKFASRPPMGLASHPYDSLLSLSPDGGVLAFALGRSEDQYSLRVQTASFGSTSPKSLADTISVEPAFSPDGRKIAYVNLIPGKGAREIRVISSEGGDSIRVAGTIDRGLRSPVWSPDGKRIWFLPNTDFSLGFVADGGGTVARVNTGTNPAVQEVGPGGRAKSGVRLSCPHETAVTFS